MDRVQRQTSTFPCFVLLFHQHKAGALRRQKRRANSSPPIAFNLILEHFLGKTYFLFRVCFLSLLEGCGGGREHGIPLLFSQNSSSQSQPDTWSTARCRIPSTNTRVSWPIFVSMGFLCLAWNAVRSARQEAPSGQRIHGPPIVHRVTRRPNRLYRTRVGYPQWSTFSAPTALADSFAPVQQAYSLY